MVRKLPQDLVDAVTRARQLERLASNTGTDEQRRHARQALNTILLAAVQGGWQKAELAPLLGIARQTVVTRVAEAEARYGENSPALVFDGPPSPPPRTADELARPIAEREWLTRKEAATIAGCSAATIRNWLLAGLLPHTRVVHSTLHLFLRADVLRIACGERYRNHGVNWTKARATVREGRIRERLG